MQQMADNKKSFLLYADMIHTLEGLKDAEAGRLIKHILRYVNDLNPVAPDRITQISFEPIKQQLKRDLARWEDYRQKQAENGKKGGRPKTQEKPNNPSLISETQKSLNVSVTVNDSVNVNESVIPPTTFENFLNTLLGNEIIKPVRCRRYGITPAKHDEFARTFVLDLQSKNKWEGEKDALVHFGNWIGKQLEFDKNKGVKQPEYTFDKR